MYLLKILASALFLCISSRYSLASSMAASVSVICVLVACRPVSSCASTPAEFILSSWLDRQDSRRKNMKVLDIILLRSSMYYHIKVTRSQYQCHICMILPRLVWTGKQWRVCWGAPVHESLSDTPSKKIAPTEAQFELNTSRDRYKHYNSILHTQCALNNYVSKIFMYKHAHNTVGIWYI